MEEVAEIHKTSKDEVSKTGNRKQQRRINRMSKSKVTLSKSLDKLYNDEEFKRLQRHFWLMIPQARDMVQIHGLTAGADGDDVASDILVVLYMLSSKSKTQGGGASAVPSPFSIGQDFNAAKKSDLANLFRRLHPKQAEIKQYCLDRSWPTFVKRMLRALKVCPCVTNEATDAAVPSGMTGNTKKAWKRARFGYLDCNENALRALFLPEGIYKESGGRQVKKEEASPHSPSVTAPGADHSMIAIPTPNAPQPASARNMKQDAPHVVYRVTYNTATGPETYLTVIFPLWLFDVEDEYLEVQLSIEGNWVVGRISYRPKHPVLQSQHSPPATDEEVDEMVMLERSEVIQTQYNVRTFLGAQSGKTLVWWRTECGVLMQVPVSVGSQESKGKLKVTGKIGGFVLSKDTASKGSEDGGSLDELLLAQLGQECSEHVHTQHTHAARGTRHTHTHTRTHDTRTRTLTHTRKPTRT